MRATGECGRSQPSALFIYSFNSGFLTARGLGLGPADCLEVGRRAAALSLASMDAVPDSLTRTALGLQ